jgi:L-Ala-D/L-Glu epimerase
MQIARLEAYPWDVPMRAPYRSAQRTTTIAQNVLVKLHLSDGTIGYGEAAPATYVTGETQVSVLRAINLAAPRLVHRAASEAPEIIAEGLVTTPGARGAMEMALYDAMARAAGLPLYRLMGGDASTPVARVTDLSLPLLSEESAAERAAQAARQGFNAIKIKIGGGDADADTRRVRAVANAAPRAKLRLDGNQGFTAQSAIRLAEDLLDLTARVELFEQPTKAGDDAAMSLVRKNTPFPVFADESCHDVEDARRLLGEGVCQGIVLKLAKSGLTGAYEVATEVVAAGGVCMFGCMMETRVGVGAALHLALALGESVVPLLDLDGHLLVNDEACVTGGPSQEGETLRVDPARPGLGVTVTV